MTLIFSRPLDRRRENAVRAETAGCKDLGMGEYEEFVFGLCRGMPLYAATPDRLITVIAARGADATFEETFPEGAQLQVVPCERGYYCRALVPTPNSLPDSIQAPIDAERVASCLVRPSCPCGRAYCCTPTSVRPVTLPV